MSKHWEACTLKLTAKQARVLGGIVRIETIRRRIMCLPYLSLLAILRKLEGGS